MNKPEKITFLLNDCTFDILDYINKNTSAVQFKELKTLSNPKTNKKYSSSTISEKLKDLTNENLLEKVIIKNKSPTQNGYILTLKAKKALELLKETENEYKKL